MFYSWKLHLAVGVFCLLSSGASVFAGVRITEIVANSSSRQLQPSTNNLFQIGGGIPWMQPSFNDTNWSMACGPFGFGTNYATDLSLWRSGPIFSLYMRQPFQVDGVTATGTGTVSITIDFNSGFVAYLNGREMIRKNMGADKSYVYYDQSAYNMRAGGSNQTWTLGLASNLLSVGTNVLAVQVHTYNTNTSFVAAPGLSVSTATGDVTLANVSNQWRYFVGTHEPSGGIVEGVNPPVGIRGLEWTLLDFDVGEWPLGAGGIGYGDGDDATDVQSQMFNICVTLYLRQDFIVSEADAALTNKLEFVVNFDDGYIAYLNGVEISRTNMGAAGSFVPYTTGATGSREAGVYVTNRLGAASLLLVPGTNVLAIQAANQTAGSSDLSIIPDLRIGGGTWLVNHGNLWSYFVGTNSPVDESDEDMVSYEPKFSDWVELWNDGSTNVSLSGWGLTDDDEEALKWQFPTNAILLPGGRLVVLCSGLNVRDASAPAWHTNFKLDPTGEYIGLYNETGTLVSEITPKFPNQIPFYSYGLDEGSGIWRYYSSPTPGETNNGPSCEGLCDTPVFLTAAGFYTNNISVTITSSTPSSAIYYTTNGSEPTVASLLYSGAISVSTSKTIRARAFRDGWVPSYTTTRTFLVNLPALLRGATAVSLAGDWQQSIFKSNGVCSIVGGIWTGGLWQASSMDDFNIPKQRGRAYERQASIEFAFPASNTVYQIDAGMRIAGSTYTRPRYVLQNMATTWYGSNLDNKPSFNFYFRSEYGKEPFTIPFLEDGSTVDFESMRLRGGHNDSDNPFIRDELSRRLLSDAGQPSARGAIVSLFVNGVFRCFFNPCQRYDEGFLQHYHGGTNEWDIRSHGGITSGDGIEWNKLMTFAANSNMSITANYLRMASMVDLENLCDYLLVNIYAAMGDWPQNNYYAARERAVDAKWRFYMWDAEGSFGQFGHPVTWPEIASNLAYNTSQSSPSAYLFAKLRTNTEFRLLFADRAYEHFFNDGALTSSNVLFRMNELGAQINPLRQYVRGASINSGLFTNWVNARLPYIISDMQNFDLWQAISPPMFSVAGGAVSNGMTIALSNTNMGGIIYYAIDGSDPRAVGGGIAGTVYIFPIVLNKTTRIKARILDGSTWSALAEEEYFIDSPPLIITEIMYNPATTGNLEFVEIFNAGDDIIDLTPVSISNGISFSFAEGSVPSLGPGEYVVVVQDLAAFAAVYDTNTMRVAGTYSGKLNNAGEEVDLMHSFFGVLQSLSYEPDWYLQTDGWGFSLTMRDPSASASLLGKESLRWKSSSFYGGSPGMADPGGIPLPGSVVINEILSHTDASPVGDWIELYNTTDASIDIGGWYLSDSRNVPYKYPVASNTLITAKGFLVFNGTNHFDNPTNLSPFAFSEYGEEAILSSGFDTNSQPTGYREVEDFGAAEREVTFGRYIRSDTNKDFVAQVSATPGATNSGPRIGPLVVAQILYQPSSNAVEYMEFYNMSATATPLYDPMAPTNTWRIEGGIDFSFPTGIVIAPLSSFFVCATNESSFRILHGMDTNPPVFGSFSGKLNNAGETIRLMKPLEFEFTNMPFTMIDRVAYEDIFPWPVPPQDGYAIERIRMAEYGNDPVNWRLGTLDAVPGPRIDEDSDGDGIPDTWEVYYSRNFLTAADGMTDVDLDGHGNLSEYVAGTDPDDRNNAFFVNIGTSNEQVFVSFLARQSQGAGYDKYNRRYSLEYLTNLLSSDWLNVGACSNLLGTNQVFELIDPLTNSPVFYRGRVWLEPK